MCKCDFDRNAQIWESLQIDYITDFLLPALQTDEPELEESKDPGRNPPAGETAEGKGVMEVGRKGEEDSATDQGGEQDVSAGDIDMPHAAASKHVDGAPEDAGHDKDKASTAVDITVTEVSSEQKDGEGEKVDNKSEEVKSCENGSDENNEKEKSKTEGEAKEADKDVNEKAAKGAEKKKQVKEVDVETKDKEKIMEVEKQGKPKRKGGPPSSLSRPRPSARSIRAAAKNDIIAKFQQGAPE